MDEPKTTAGMTPPRREQFEADIAQIRVKTGGSASEAKLAVLGVVLMVVGSGLALFGFVASGSQSDSRDILSTLILAVFGLCLVVAGAVVFLRYSMARFLRFWLLRLIYEHQAPAPGE